MKKRVLSFLIALAIFVNMLPLSGCRRPGLENVSRGEWITMLANAFGLDSYTTQTPYYSDVPAGSEYFTVVQSAGDWNVLSVFDDSELKVKRAVTCGEVASTVAAVVGYTDPNSALSIDDALKFATENEIVPGNKKKSAKMNAEECEAALEAAKEYYLSAPLEKKTVVVKNENVVDLTELPPERFEPSDSQITIPSGSYVPTVPEVAGDETADTPVEREQADIKTGSGKTSIKVGNVVVTAPTQEHPAGTAYKISAIQEMGGELVVATEEPTLGDLYDELDVAETVEADLNNIIWAPGITATPTAEGMSANGLGSYEITLLSTRPQQINAVPMAEFTTNHHLTFDFGKGSFEKNWTNETPDVLGNGPGALAFSKSCFSYDGNPSVDDFAGSTSPWTNDLIVQSRASGGYKITGGIDINALTVSTSIKFNKGWLDIPTGVKSASVGVSTDIEATLRMEGNLSEHLKIASIPIPIAATGLSVAVELYLYVDANGHLQVSAGLGSATKIEYDEGKLKRVSTSDAHAAAEAAIKINFGADLSATLDALGLVRIMDVGAKAGAELDARAAVTGSCIVAESGDTKKLTYRESMNINAELYAPLLSVYVGGSKKTLIGGLGIGGNWDIMSKSNGAKKYEIVNEEWVFWEETVTQDGNGSATDKGETEPENKNTNSVRLDFSSYTLMLSDSPVQLELLVEQGAGEAMPEIVWTSDNESVATVDDGGIVRPIANGQATITAALKNNPSIYVSCSVFVSRTEEGDAPSGSGETIDPEPTQTNLHIQTDTYLEQQNGDGCYIATAAMILSNYLVSQGKAGVSYWDMKSINGGSVNFDWNCIDRYGVYDYDYYASRRDGSITADSKLEKIIAGLKENPYGVFLCGIHGSDSHAVVVTGYEDGVILVNDPARYGKGGKGIPLVDSYMGTKGFGLGTQEQILNSVNSITTFIPY